MGFIPSNGPARSVRHRAIVERHAEASRELERTAPARGLSLRTGVERRAHRTGTNAAQWRRRRIDLRPRQSTERSGRRCTRALVVGLFSCSSGRDSQSPWRGLCHYVRGSSPNSWWSCRGVSRPSRPFRRVPTCGGIMTCCSPVCREHSAVGGFASTACAAGIVTVRAVRVAVRGMSNGVTIAVSSGTDRGGVGRPKPSHRHGRVTGVGRGRLSDGWVSCVRFMPPAVDSGRPSTPPPRQRTDRTRAPRHWTPRCE